MRTSPRVVVKGPAGSEIACFLQIREGLLDESSALLRKRWVGRISGWVKHHRERGIIWCDVKDENVLLYKKDEDRIVDFDGAVPRAGWTSRRLES